VYFFVFAFIGNKFADVLTLHFITSKELYTKNL
jgi:hypothetical protein